MMRTKHRDGCYRYSMRSAAWFGQIVRDDTLRRPSWHAELRDCRTGAVIRYGGKWSTRRAAEDEIAYLMTTALPNDDDGNKHDVDDPLYIRSGNVVQVF